VEAATDGGGPFGGVGGRGDVDGEAEAVEELRSQIALLGVHGADEDEAGVVSVGDAVALDAVEAAGGDVEEDVDEVLGEQVDLVDVEAALVRRGEQTLAHLDAPAGESGAEVEGADDPFLGGAEG